MKRIVLLLSFVMFCVVSMFAKADVTLQSGSLSKLKTSKATCNFGRQECEGVLERKRS